MISFFASRPIMAEAFRGTRTIRIGQEPYRLLIYPAGSDSMMQHGKTDAFNTFRKSHLESTVDHGTGAGYECDSNSFDTGTKGTIQTSCDRIEKRGSNASSSIDDPRLV